MVTNSSFNTAQRLSSTLPQFSNHSLSRRINLIFWFNIAYLTAGVFYCVSQLNQAYQLRQHTCFGLDDRFKLAKCQSLLDEAKEKEFQEAQPLLQKCDALLASISARGDSLHDKTRFLVELAEYYAEHDPERSYQIAMTLTSSHHIFSVAKRIQEKNSNFDTGELNTLFVRAYNAKLAEDVRPNRDPSLFANHPGPMLGFAKVFHSLNNSELSNECMSKACELANNEENDLARVLALCHIARCYKKMENLELMASSIQSAQDLLDQKSEDVNTIEARLSFATNLFFLEDFERMDQELRKVVALMESNNPLIAVKNLDLLARLINMIRKSEKAQSDFKDFKIEPLIERALGSLDQNEPGPARAKAYLAIASTYQEGLENLSVERNVIWNKAFEEIQNLPEGTAEEVHSKIGLFLSFSHFCQNDESLIGRVMSSLESLYEKCPVDFGNSSELLWQKSGFGKTILMLYKKTNLKQEEESFSRKYLSDLQTGENDRDMFSKISRLAIYGKSSDDAQESRTHLEMAEALLPQITSSISYNHAYLKIIEGYLKIDRKKGLELLENYENQQAKQRLINAAVVPIIMGIAHFYPKIAPLLLAGSSVYSTWRSPV